MDVGRCFDAVAVEDRSFHLRLIFTFPETDARAIEL